MSNSVVVVAGERLMARAELLINQLDESIDADGVSVRTIKLEHTRADALAPILDQIVQRNAETDMMPSWMLSSYLANGGKVRQSAKVIAETRMNAIIVTGPTPVLDLAEQVAAELDIPQDNSRSIRPVRVLAINNAEASTIAETINAIFEEEASATYPPVVRVDQQSNALVIRASEDQFARIDSLVNDLDATAMGTSRQLRRIDVDPSRMPAGEMAEILRKLLEDRSGVRVEIMSTDELLNKGTEQGSRFPIRSNPTPAGFVYEAISGLVQVHATYLSQGFTELAEERSDQPEEESQSKEPDVVITVDPVTNALIVTGSTVMTDRLAQLASEIESMAPSEPSRARVIRLPNDIDPNSVALVLSRTAQQIGRRSDSNPGGFT
ncbi:MAG: hypothetical protein F6K11_31845, partial [Leptolyngbya sp. SIO3F4]|nr:hypothetical protein [Leptolyngbya sp. SIO3F4]